MHRIINGRYKLQGEVGSGGMGIVYEAVDRLTGDVVAFKQVHLNTDLSYEDSAAPGATLEALRMLHAKEFQILAGLRHPNIISVLDYGFDEDQKPFFTMNLLRQSETLLEAGAQVGFDQKIDLIEQLLQGLAYLHRRGILHRDIKPENVLVTGRGVRLLDFGLSQQVDEFGAYGGSPLYMAPEIMEGKEPTPTSDLYSVGILLYQLLAHAHPYSLSETGFDLELLSFEPEWSPVDNRLQPLLKRLLVKNPAERYQSASQVLNDLAQSLDRPMVKESKEIRESFLQAATFVGREQELKRLQAPLSETQREKGTVFLLGGESGVGKSRLLDELRSRALVSGWQVVVGQEIEEGGAPYQLWHEIILRLCLTGKPNGLDAGVLNEVVPALQMLLGMKIAPPPLLNGSEGELRFTLSLISLLQQQAKPTLLILEDLHWSDESLGALKQILKLLNQLPNVVIVGSYRHDERPDLPQELPGSQSIVLNRLNDGEIARLSGAMLGKIGEQKDVVSLLTKETEGNTFFIIEVMRSLAEEAGQLAEIGGGELPAEVFTRGMEDLLQRRINRVAPTELPLLRLAAVAGRRINLELLKTLVPEFEIEKWLQAVSDSAVLILRDGQWMFSHDKIRHATLAQLDSDDLKAAHRKVATQIEMLYPEDERYFSALFDHWQAAGEIEKELAYLFPVAKRLIRVLGDYDQGKRLVSRGLELISLGDSRRVEILNLHASLCIREAKFDEGQEVAEEVLKLAKAADDLEGQATSLNTLGVICRERSQYTKARAYFREALMLAKHADCPVNMASTLIELGVVAEFQKEYEKAESYFEQSLSLYQLLDDQIGLTKCYFYLGMLAAQYHNDFEKSLAYAQQSLEIFEAVGNHRSIAKSYTSMGIDFASTGRYETAREYFEKSLAIKESIGDTAGIAHTHLVLGEAYFFEGAEYDKAYHYSKKSLDLYLDINLLAVIGIDYGYIVLSQLSMGNVETALDFAVDHFKLQSTIEYDKSNGLVHAGMAKILAAVQDRDIEKSLWEKIDQITEIAQIEPTPLAYMEEAIQSSTIAQIRMVVLIECGCLALKMGEMDVAVKYLEEALERAQFVNNQHKLNQIKQILQELPEFA